MIVKKAKKIVKFFIGTILWTTLVLCTSKIFFKSNSKFLQIMDPVQAAAIADQTIAAAMAAKDDLAKKLLPVNSPPHAPPTLPPPAFGGFVRNSDPPPATERCKLIRLHRDLKRQPPTLGGSGGSSPATVDRIGNFHSTYDGRLPRSILIEEISTFSVLTASFQPSTWCCVSCSANHVLLPKKRNISQ